MNREAKISLISMVLTMLLAIVMGTMTWLVSLLFSPPFSWALVSLLLLISFIGGWIIAATDEEMYSMVFER